MPMLAPIKPQPELDESQAIWDQLRSQLRLSLVGNPALRPLERAKPLGQNNRRLTVLMPDDASADVWRSRMQIPLERAVIRAFDEPLTVLFLGPTEMAMFVQ